MMGQCGKEIILFALSHACAEFSLQAGAQR